MTATPPLSAIAAGLAAWVREGNEPDLPPRLDQAVQAFAARAPEPPEWWHALDRMPAGLDVADYWPQVGYHFGQHDPGAPRPSVESIREARRRYPSRTIKGASTRARLKQLAPGGRVEPFTSQDVLDNTYAGDSVLDVARRLQVTLKALQNRRARYPEMAHQMDLRRGKLPAVTQEEAR